MAQFLQSAPWAFSTQLERMRPGTFRLESGQPLVGRFYDSTLPCTRTMRSYYGVSGLTPAHIPALTEHAKRTKRGCFATLETENSLPRDTVAALTSAGWRTRAGERRPACRTVKLQLPDDELWEALGLPAEHKGAQRAQIVPWKHSAGAVVAFEELGRRAPHRVISPLHKPRPDGLRGIWESFSDAGRMKVHSVNSPDGALLAGAVTVGFGNRAWLGHLYGPQRQHDAAESLLIFAVAQSCRNEGLEFINVPDVTLPRQTTSVPTVYDLPLGPGYFLWRAVHWARERMTKQRVYNT